jgi:DNA-binding SARP family transcriptional activator/uncharacterized protein HemY
MLGPVRDAIAIAGRAGPAPPAIEALAGEACRVSGDYGAATGYFERALAADGGDQRLAGPARAAAMQGLAYALLKTGEPDRAAATAKEALEMTGEQEPALRARVLNTLAIAEYRGDRLSDAVSLWQEALRLARRADDQHLTLMIAHNLGLPHAVMGEFQKASECFQILTGSDNARLGPEEGAAYLNLARIAIVRGEIARAGSLLADAKEIAQKWRLPALRADVLESEGTLLRESGDLEGARARYAQARTLFLELGRLDLIDNLAEEEAVLAARLGDRDGGRAAAEALVAGRRSGADRRGLPSSLLALGEILVRAGAAPAAIDPLVEAADLFEAAGRAYEGCVSRLWLAAALTAAGRARRAESEAEAALKAAARHDYRAAVLRVAEAAPALRPWIEASGATSAWLAESPTARSGEPTRARAAVDGPDLTVRLLGSVEVFRDPGVPIPPAAWKIRRALLTFCYIATSRSHRATKDRIADAVWGDTRPSVIEKNFHPTISFLRRALNHGHNVPKSFILCEGGAYSLNPSYRYEIDAELFETKIRGAREKARRDVRAALSDYEEALALYRGPFMEEEYDEWMEAPRSRYEALHAAGLAEAGELHMKHGDPEAGIARLEKGVANDPLDEEASCRLMRAHGLRGNRAAVEKEFLRLTRSLDSDLRASPSPRTRAVYEGALKPGAAGKV